MSRRGGTVLSTHATVQHAVNDHDTYYNDIILANRLLEATNIDIELNERKWPGGLVRDNGMVEW